MHEVDEGAMIAPSLGAVGTKQEGHGRNKDNFSDNAKKRKATNF